MLANQVTETGFDPSPLFGAANQLLDRFLTALTPALGAGRAGLVPG